MAVATDRGKQADLDGLAGRLAENLKGQTPRNGQSIAVITLRNRSGTLRGRTVAEEVADKVANALVETGWLEVYDRIDLENRGTA